MTSWRVPSAALSKRTRSVHPLVCSGVRPRSQAARRRSPADDTADVTVTNHLTQLPPETGSLKVTKDIPGVPGDFTGSFDVRVTCTDGDPIDRTISFPDPGFITVDGLRPGAVCAVSRRVGAIRPMAPSGPVRFSPAQPRSWPTRPRTSPSTNLLAEQNAVTPPPNVPHAAPHRLTPLRTAPARRASA